MRAVKANKEYTIDESQQKVYQDAGFDIYDDAGVLTAYGKGKTVPYGDYVNALESIDRSQRRITELEAELAGTKAENDDLSKIIEDWKAKQEKTVKK